MTATLGVRPAPGRGRARARHRLAVLGFMAPAIIGFVLFFGYPLVATVIFSFTKYDLINPPEFNGLDNYAFMFKDPLFTKAISNTLWFVVGAHDRADGVRAGRGVGHRTSQIRRRSDPHALLPAFTGTAGGRDTRVLHGDAAQRRPARQASSESFGLDSPLWFSDPAWAKPGITAIMLWISGDLMIIILAAILDVPQEQYEAAELDGAGPIRRWWHVTLPTISPVLLFGIVNSVILALQLFTQAVVAGSAAIRLGGRDRVDQDTSGSRTTPR